MSVSDLNLEEKWGRYSRSLENALNIPALADRLALYSYTHEKVSVGKELLTAVLRANELKTREYGEQYEATDTLQFTWNEIMQEVTILRGVSRVVFKEDSKSYNFLKLPGRIKRARDAATIQIDELLNNIEESQKISTALATYGFSAMRLAGIREKLITLPPLKVSQDLETAEAQQATADRDSKNDTLEDWMSDFTAIARLAVLDQPELLELIGYTVDSSNN